MMKFYSTRWLATICLMLLGAVGYSQCTNTTQWLSSAAPTVGNSNQITTCIYSTEYTEVTGVDSNASYQTTAFLNNGSVPGYITITQGTPGGTVVDHGPSALLWTAPAAGTYYIHVTEDSACTGGSNCHTLIIENFGAGTTCFPPSGLGVANVTATSADFAWNSNNMASAAWELAIVPAGNPPVANATSPTTTYSAMGLMPATGYDAFVREICSASDTSTWIGPVSFVTDCQAITPAYNTDFATFLPACWDEADAGNLATGPTGIGFGSWTSTGTLARINLWTTGKSDWLLSPDFDLSSGNWELVIEASGQDFGANPGVFGGMHADDSVVVAVSTDGGLTWAPLYTFDASNQFTNMATDYPIALTGLNGNSNRFGIWASEGATSGAPDYYANIHSFEIREVCSVTSALSLDAGVGCPGQANGAATATPSGGTMPYTYLWSNGDSVASVTGLTAGTYTVVITDSSGCSVTDSIAIPEPTPVNVNALLDSSASCFGFADGSASANASGGTGPYTYLWSNGNTTPVASGLIAGNYSVVVTDSFGCVDSAAVVVTEPTEVVGSTSVDAMINCFGDQTGALSVSASGGSGSFTYLWSNSDTSSSISGLGAGTYTVVTTDTDGCSTVDTIQLMEPAALVLTANADSNVSCNGFSDGVATANVSGGTAGYTFNWSNGGMTPSINGLVAGGYAVTVMDSNGCMEMDSVFITEPAALTSSAVVTDETGSSDGAIDITVGGGTAPYDFLWSNGATTEDISNLPGGVYTVTITDANGCTTTLTDTVSTIIAVDATELEGVSVYPNPSRGQVRIQLSSWEEASYMLFDVQGKMLDAAEFDSNLYELTLPEEQGVYLLSIKQGAAIKNIRLIRL